MAKQPIKGIIGGRAGGKSTAMGYDIWNDVIALPQFSSCIVGKNFRELRQTIIPNAIQFWKKLNFMEYDPITGLGDYVKWKEPPASFKKPHICPEDWRFCITFRNGHVLNVLSFYNADSNRGGSYQVINLDEAGFFKQDHLKILNPMLRGNIEYPASKHYRYRGFKFFSSPPYRADGQWVWEYEDLAKKYPERYFFRWMPTIDNIEFLGNDYIKDLKNSLLDIEYRVEVLGERLTRISKTFYPTFDEDKHVVYPEHDFMGDYDEKNQVWVDSKKFYNPDDVIVCVLDFNAHFTCCTVWQEVGQWSKMVGTLFVKEADPGKTIIQTLAVRVAQKYRNHKKKEIILTGDRNGANQSPNSTLTMYQNFGAVLKTEGWKADERLITVNKRHEIKYGYISDVFSEKRTDLFKIRIDGIECKSAIISIQNSPLLPNYEKDKTSERPSKGVAQERATHISDTVDYYCEYRRLSALNLIDSEFSIELI